EARKTHWPAEQQREQRKTEEDGGQKFERICYSGSERQVVVENSSSGGVLPFRWKVGRWESGNVRVTGWNGLIRTFPLSYLLICHAMIRLIASAATIFPARSNYSEQLLRGAVRADLVAVELPSRRPRDEQRRSGEQHETRRGSEREAVRGPTTKKRQRKQIVVHDPN